MQSPTLIDLDAERQRRATRPKASTVPRDFDARLSALIDRATVELESANPATVGDWRRVLAALVDKVPR